MQCIPYKMFNKIRNCGDAINPFVIEHISGLSSYCARDKGDHVLGAGSIFSYADKTSHIWGTGMLDPSWDIPEINSSQIRALRGKLTLGVLRSRGYDIPDIPLGDPGIFASELIANEALSKQYRAAIVPHFRDFRNPEIRRLAAGDDVCLVDMKDYSLEPLKQIARSEIVLSQSLHGLIFSESLGIPSLWITRKTDDRWKFKFLDWYSTTNNPQHDPRSIAEPFDTLIKSARAAESNIDRTALRNSFPCEIAREFDDDIIGHEACKKNDPVIIPFQIPETSEIEKQKSICQEVLAVRRAVIQRMSYPTYSIVGSIALEQNTLMDVLRIMDESSPYSFGTIMRKLAYPGELRVHKRYGIHFSISDSLLGEAIIIRPNGRIKSSLKRVVFWFD